MQWQFLFLFRALNSITEQQYFFIFSSESSISYFYRRSVAKKAHSRKNLFPQSYEIGWGAKNEKDVAEMREMIIFRH